MDYTSAGLNEFVSRSDSLGGPGTPQCQAFWAGFTFRPTYQVNQDLDPFSEAYVREQMAVYEELAGKPYESHANEQTTFDVERHIAAVNPYDHPDPGALALHVERLSRALRLARPRRGEVLLDMGCGWGLSSEIAAYLGLTVKAVDINPAFVQLVNERAARNSYAISAVIETFESYSPGEPADLALFYECLHHAVRPWAVVDRLVANLKDGARLVLAGEPINEFWWKHWGMRLDPLSVYCIRKFGWFESGWTAKFITAVLIRAGLSPRVFDDSDPDIGYAIVATKGPQRISGAMAAVFFQATGCVVDQQDLILTGRGALTIVFPTTTSQATLNFTNNRGRKLRVGIKSAGIDLFDGDMEAGSMAVSVPRGADTAVVEFRVERWVPDEELGNGDKRIIGLHMSDVSLS